MSSALCLVVAQLVNVGQLPMCWCCSAVSCLGQSGAIRQGISKALTCFSDTYGPLLEQGEKYWPATWWLINCRSRFT
jgi:ribosomal protein S9